MRKLTLSGAKRKCHNLWSKCVRERDGHRCLLCGSEGRVEAHHGIVPRGNCVGPHWFFIDNGFSLCYLCHQIVHTRRGDKVALERWLALVDSMVNKERQEEMIRAKHTTPQYRLDDYEGIYESLAKAYDRIKEEQNNGN